jgi:short-subunit dehydrogenase
MNTQKWALITGASSGIGYALAKELDQLGYSLVLVARRLDLLQKLQTQLSRTAQICIADLGDPDKVRSVYQFCQERQLFIELLINNAGFGRVGLFANEPEDVMLQMIQVNIAALAQLTHLFLPQMQQQKKGHIIQVASVAGFYPGPSMANYYATKAYVLSLSQALAYELKPYGIKVTALCPGPVHSEFAKVAKASSSRLFKHHIASPEQVARYAIKHIKNPRVIAVHGILFRFFIFCTRLVPRSWVVAVTHLLNNTKEQIS